MSCTPRPLYRELASLVQARLNCHESSNTIWFDRHEDNIEQICKDYLPSGSGIDTGTTIDLDRSKPDKLVFLFSYHHMNDVGMYDGWTDHTVIVTPSLAHGYHLRITGRDRNMIKDYLADTYGVALDQMIWQEDIEPFRYLSEHYTEIPRGV